MAVKKDAKQSVSVIIISGLKYVLPSDRNTYFVSKGGVIHFAPPVLSTSSMFEPAFCALELSKANGATERTVIRGLGARWEQALNEILP